MGHQFGISSVHQLRDEVPPGDKVMWDVSDVDDLTAGEICGEAPSSGRSALLPGPAAMPRGRACPDAPRTLRGVARGGS